VHGVSRGLGLPRRPMAYFVMTEGGMDWVDIFRVLWYVGGVL
jgi:hypothetical protein